MIVRQGGQARGVQSQERVVAVKIALFQNGGNLSLSDSEIFLVAHKITGKTDFAILLGGEKHEDPSGFPHK